MSTEIIILIVIASGLICYQLVLLLAIVWRKNTASSEQHNEPVSVIIAARNEAESLLNYLPQVLDQDYPNFEVIVVNDCSTDETPDILRGFQERYPNLKVSTVQENRSFEGGKKFAISMGIKAAKHESLVFIDADCYPASNQWLKLMASGLTKRNIVLGYGGLTTQKGFLNALIRFDTLWVATQYLGFAKLGMPYMGVGRNMGYKQFLFFDNKGFATHLDLRSGDDDLFVNQVANAKNTTVMLDPNAFTFSPAKQSLKAWLWQKKRHVTTSPRYKALHKLVLSIYPLLVYSFQLVVLMCLMVLPISSWWLIGSVIAGKLFLHAVVGFFVGKQFENQWLGAAAPLLEFPLFLFYPIVLASNFLEEANTWRKI